jgi:hypothetical protein
VASPSPSLSLSPSTSHQIDWQAINRATIGLGTSRSTDGDGNGSVDPVRIQTAFATLKTEFTKAAAPLRRSMAIIVPLMLLAFGVAVAAGFVLPLIPWGAVTAGASILATLGLGQRIWRMARDQMMLELIPARYELAFGLSETAEQRRQLIRQFIADTALLQKQPGK